MRIAGLLDRAGDDSAAPRRRIREAVGREAGAEQRQQPKQECSMVTTTRSSEQMCYARGSGSVRSRGKSECRRRSVAKSYAH